MIKRHAVTMNIGSFQSINSLCAEKPA